MRLSINVRTLSRRILQGLAANFARSVQEFEPNFRWMGSLGAFCFVFYWAIWKYCFVQPYENLGLRLLGALLAGGLALSDRWPIRLRERWLNLYAGLTLIYVFPFFFTYMLLQNQGSAVWVMSTLVACFLTILLVDVWNLICIQLLGAGLAIGVYAATASPEQFAAAELHPRELLLFIFLFVMGSAFNLRAEIMRREKSRAMMLMGAQMAHELRTPLAGIKIGLAGLSRLLDEHYRPRQDQPRLDATRMAQMRMLKRQIVDQADHAGTLIDMLLLNANREKSGSAGRGVEAMPPLLVQELLETTIANYPFVSAGERELVQIRGDFRFYIRGQRDLLICVFYNLLKNAIYAVHRAGRQGAGLIEFVAHSGVSAGQARILVRDAGEGIAPGDLPRIFDQFYTTKPGCAGIGVGLWNTRQILSDHDGEITVRSQPGSFTEFELRFPALLAASGDPGTPGHRDTGRSKRRSGDPRVGPIGGADRSAHAGQRVTNPGQIPRFETRMDR